MVLTVRRSPELIGTIAKWENRKDIFETLTYSHVRDLELDVIAGFLFFVGGDCCILVEVDATPSAGESNLRKCGGSSGSESVSKESSRTR
ncbi:hypothetical protein TNCV_3848031 [Trichonephila clavipes]|uniref:Uncharacterized protein n=1 Tax=Trichonephila clavipes TaxID=2585209 RepID=A0A8X6V0G0_TRICX|nr:hypothetical protein TNCV_3848031 [Trichonephila clavipes]